MLSFKFVLLFKATSTNFYFAVIVAVPVVKSGSVYNHQIPFSQPLVLDSWSTSWAETPAGKTYCTFLKKCRATAVKETYESVDIQLIFSQHIPHVVFCVLNYLSAAAQGKWVHILPEETVTHLVSRKVSHQLFFTQIPISYWNGFFFCIGLHTHEVEKVSSMGPTDYHHREGLSSQCISRCSVPAFASS